MSAQAAEFTEQAVPAVATLRSQPTLLCATCRGTGALGRTQKFEPIGDTTLVLTKTHWCPTCKGAGQVWQERRKSA